MAYYGAVGQGDTDNAADCRVAYNKLKAKYGSSNVLIAGFNNNSDVPLTNRANQSNFIAAKSAHVLYWSSHGSSAPALNVINGPMFNSGMTAYNNWRNTSNRLKVPIFAACYQFDGDANRSAWANNIMRKSDIRAMCGYHGSAPSSTDAQIATKFFDYCSAGSTGNSVMYSWKNANATTSGGSSYLILVYYDNGRCYYRLPGFSTQTYADPDRSTTKIYRYSSAKPNGAVVPNSGTTTLNSAPYSLEIEQGSCLTLDVSEWNPTQRICTNPDTNAMFYGLREYSMNPVSSEQGRSYNYEFLYELLGKDCLASSQVNVYDDAMAEIPQDGSKEEEVIIGSTMQVFQHYSGIRLEENCIAACSDASGVISLSNQWQSYKLSKGVDHIDLVHNEHRVFDSLFTRTMFDSTQEQSKVMVAYPLYIRNKNRYILHYDVTFDNGQHLLIDSKQLTK